MMSGVAKTAEAGTRKEANQSKAFNQISIGALALTFSIGVVISMLTERPEGLKLWVSYFLLYVSFVPGIMLLIFGAINYHHSLKD